MIDVALPEGIVPGPLPAAIERYAPQFSFRQQWSVESNHLRVRTEISSSVTGMVCGQYQINSVRTAYGAIEQRTNPVLTFASRPIDSPAQAQGPAARQPNPDASTVAPTQPGTPSNPVQTIELARAVPIDHKIEIDFIYALNADCSLIGLPTARVIGQPSNGNVAVENGTGFSNFPPENQRYECNKRKSDGVSIFYEPRQGFAGADSITLDIIFPHGLETKRHYSIEVK